VPLVASQSTPLSPLRPLCQWAARAMGAPSGPRHGTAPDFAPLRCSNSAKSKRLAWASVPECHPNRNPYLEAEEGANEGADDHDGDNTGDEDSHGEQDTARRPAGLPRFGYGRHGRNDEERGG